MDDYIRCTNCFKAVRPGVDCRTPGCPVPDLMIARISPKPKVSMRGRYRRQKPTMFEVAIKSLEELFGLGVAPSLSNDQLYEKIQQEFPDREISRDAISRAMFRLREDGFFSQFPQGGLPFTRKYRGCKTRIAVRIE